MRTDRFRDSFRAIPERHGTGYKNIIIYFLFNSSKELNSALLYGMIHTEYYVKI